MNTAIDHTNKYCIIGAGPSGLAAAKNLKAAGIPFDVYEGGCDVGGIWDIANENSTVYKSTYTITSKQVTAYTDYPMPADYPVYCHHSEVLAYLRSYARHFGLYDSIHFNSRVQKVEKYNGHWDVTVAEKPTRRYRGVIIANGHNWSPKTPSYPGEFTGPSLHSKQYKDPDMFKGKRVLVVGSGNTGCDIAVDASRVAAKVFLSARRGYHYLPKFVGGTPPDQIGQASQRISLPIGIIRFFFRILIRLSMGDQAKYGLPKPDHRLLETPPIANSLLPYYVAHGAVKIKPDIERFDGDKVVFKNGEAEPIDTIVYATGYKPDFPFIDSTHLNWNGTHPHLYLFIFHPEYSNLFCAGLTDGTGGHFPTVDYQTQLIARFIAAHENGDKRAQAFIAAKRGPQPNLSRGIKFIDTPRNYTQFELIHYTNLLRRMIKQFN
jgi:cation diffusion facilitator CzcD-associated flavoprotein CzcO